MNHDGPCRKQRTFASREEASAWLQRGFRVWKGGASRMFWCGEHQGWHVEVVAKGKHIPCPKCGGVPNQQGWCRCQREKLRDWKRWSEEAELDDGWERMGEDEA